MTILFLFWRHVRELSTLKSTIVKHLRGAFERRVGRAPAPGGLGTLQVGGSGATPAHQRLGAVWEGGRQGLFKTRRTIGSNLDIGSLR
jgi:hypothetical protein